MLPRCKIKRHDVAKEYAHQKCPRKHHNWMLRIKCTWDHTVMFGKLRSCTVGAFCGTHTLHYITLRYSTLHNINITLHYIHYITLHYITLHYITLYTLHYMHQNIHTYIHTYLHTYIHTQILTYLHYITLHYNTYLHTYLPTYPTRSTADRRPWGNEGWPWGNQS